MGFPAQRPRRLRRTETIRSLVRETDLSAGDLILPLFVCPGKRVRQEIGSMPGQFNLSVDEAVAEAQEARSLGLPAVILFGIPPAKDAKATGAYDPQGIVQEAASAIKKEVQGMLVVADVCLCEYTDHGHCGVVQGDDILNDETLDLLASFQASVVEDLTERTLAAADQLRARAVLVTGGVAANSRLRKVFGEECAARKWPVYFPSLELSTDNAAMIAAAAYPKFLAGEFADLGLNADPSLKLGV